jgi:uncharacterized protein (DUF58 family)
MQSATALPNLLVHPVGNLRGRFQRFFLERIAPSDSTTLTQRTVYILPTRPGWALGLTLLVLLVASINYQLNLGFILTFLLAGSAVVGMHMCHGTLRGLTMQLVAPQAQFARSPIQLEIKLQSQRKRVRHGIGVAVWGTDQWTWTDVPAQGSVKVQIAFHANRRGRHPAPAITAETRFPLGTFRVWTVWRPAASLLIYPTPELRPPALPPGEPRGAGTANVVRQNTGEFDGVRAYRRGDPLKTVVWKKAAKSDTLVSRDTQQVQRYELWLDLAQTGAFKGSAGMLEQRISRLCAWVLVADKQEMQYGLRLGNTEIAPASGEAHRRVCLQALALYQAPGYV